MISPHQLEALADLLARRFASFLRAPLANAAPSATGGPPIQVFKKNSSGTPVGQVNGLTLQGQTWTVTISCAEEAVDEGGPSGGPYLPSVREWIYLKLKWTIGMAKHTAYVDLPAASVSFTLPFDVLEVYVINQSPPGTPVEQEIEPLYSLAVATAWAGRQTARARRTIRGVTPDQIVPPPFASSVIFTWSAKPTQDLEIQFLNAAGQSVGTTTLSSAAPIQQPLPMDIPHGTAAIAVLSTAPIQYTAIFTLSI